MIGKKVQIIGGLFDNETGVIEELKKGDLGKNKYGIRLDYGNYIVYQYDGDFKEYL